MSTKWAWIITVGALVFLVATGGIGTYNSLVSYEQAYEKQVGDVESVYQRRLDLIPNLVATAKGYMAHEAGVFKAVADARASVGQVKLDAKNLTPEMLEQFQKSQAELGGALSKLIAVSENYPNLKADQQFVTLMAQIEGSENRISVERRKLNGAAADYNTRRKGFGTRFFAGLFGMDFPESKPYFKADEGANKAPTVDFGGR